MLCFNRRLGCLESGTQNPAITAVRNLFEMFQQSFTKQSYKYFRTKFYRQFEAEGRTIHIMVLKLGNTCRRNELNIKSPTNILTVYHPIIFLNKCFITM
jgi:hypothetical protein